MENDVPRNANRFETEKNGHTPLVISEPFFFSIGAATQQPDASVALRSAAQLNRLWNYQDTEERWLAVNG